MPGGIRATTLGLTVGVAVLGGATAPTIVKTAAILSYLPDVVCLVVLVLTYHFTHDIPEP